MNRSAIGFGAAAGGLGLAAVLLGTRRSSASPASPATVPTAGAGVHQAARGVVRDAFTAEMVRAPSLPEVQFAQAIGWHETRYGRGWKGAMVGAHNWGAVQCSQPGAGCISWHDTNPDGSSYVVSFRSYPSDLEGARDLVRHVFKLRQHTARELARERPSVFRASYAMRRERYYSEVCPIAAAKYGKEAARASFQGPDRDEGTRACARESVTTHARLVFAILQQIAAANGEPVALELGDYDEADRWWHGGEEGGGAGVVVAALVALAAGGAWYRLRRRA